MDTPFPSDQRSVTVTFLPDNVQVSIPVGASLLDAASQDGVTLRSSCGGRGTCGKCRVRVVSPSIEPIESERRHLSPEELQNGFRLACLYRPTEDLTVEVPTNSRLAREKISLESVGRQIEVEPNIWKVPLQLPHPSLSDQRADLRRVMESLGDGVRFPSDLSVVQDLPKRLRACDFNMTAVVYDGELIDVECGNTSDRLYGMAFDIGTTTIVGYLMHLVTGKQVAVCARVNPQTQFGDDVISRISYSSNNGGLLRLQQMVVQAINEITADACKESGIAANTIYEFALVGNTCMTHLLLGLDPASLATAPYVPANSSSWTTKATDLGIVAHPRARAYVLPNIAGFVGADTVGVIVASGLEEPKGLRVAVDIGTNGEVVLSQNGRLIACSTAAGPAFEGARISQGMRAASGAIDQVTLARTPDGKPILTKNPLQVHTIDDTPARGLCGSGLVDAVTVLLELGIITPTGRLLDAKSAPAEVVCLLDRFDGEGGQTRFILVNAESSATGQPVCLTSQDVRELQNGKAAICAGVMTLLEDVSARPEDVDELLLAGAFGNYIRRENALALGLIPAVPLERVRPVGNAAGLGARLALASRAIRRLAEDIAQRVEYVELSDRAEFYRQFTDAMELAPVHSSVRD